jgi:hypothetical protein
LQSTKHTHTQKNSRRIKNIMMFFSNNNIRNLFLIVVLVSLAVRGVTSTSSLTARGIDNDLGSGGGARRRLGGAGGPAAVGGAAANSADRSAAFRELIAGGGAGGSSDAITAKGNGNANRNLAYKTCDFTDALACVSTNQWKVGAENKAMFEKEEQVICTQPSQFLPFSLLHLSLLPTPTPTRSCMYIATASAEPLAHQMIAIGAP